MKRIGITKRVEHIQGYNESRDCLDQRWAELFLELNCITIPLPNINPKYVSSLLDTLNLDLIVFSGGNSLTVLDTTAKDASPKRDAFESVLLKESVSRNIPVFGVCRGMQMINLEMGGILSKVEDHIAVNHPLSSLTNVYNFTDTVNSYHSWGIAKNNLSKELTSLAEDRDGNVEAFENRDKNIFAIMWHPERETPFQQNDLDLIKRFL
jgi:putative glutamine amidotransferase